MEKLQMKNEGSVDLTNRILFGLHKKNNGNSSVNSLRTSRKTLRGSKRARNQSRPQSSKVEMDSSRPLNPNNNFSNSTTMDDVWHQRSVSDNHSVRNYNQNLAERFSTVRTKDRDRHRFSYGPYNPPVSSVLSPISSSQRNSGYPIHSSNTCQNRTDGNWTHTERLSNVKFSHDTRLAGQASNFYASQIGSTPLSTYSEVTSYPANNSSDGGDPLTMLLMRNFRERRNNEGEVQPQNNQLTAQRFGDTLEISRESVPWMVPPRINLEAGPSDRVVQQRLKCRPVTAQHFTENSERPNWSRPRLRSTIPNKSRPWIRPPRMDVEAGPSNRINQSRPENNSVAAQRFGEISEVLRGSVPHVHSSRIDLEAGQSDTVSQPRELTTLREAPIVSNFVDITVARPESPDIEIIGIINNPTTPQQSIVTREERRPTRLRGILKNPKPVVILTREAAVSREIVESFGLNGLITAEEEVTDIEETIFQRVLRTKLVCHICMTHMKLYRCSNCLYSMCEDCTNTITCESPGNVTCPHCRENQKAFEQIKLPRL